MNHPARLAAARHCGRRGRPLPTHNGLVTVRTAMPALAVLTLAALTACSGSGTGDPVQPASSTPQATTSTASVSPAPSPAQTAGSQALAPCTTADLQVTVRPDKGGGAAGSTYLAVVFTNRGSLPCTLDGHPGVSFVTGDNGTQVGAAADREKSGTRVTLQPRTQAHATLRQVQAGNFDKQKCRPVQALGYRVYPPDQRASAFVPAKTTACAATSVHLLTVGPVVAGAPTD